MDIEAVYFDPAAAPIVAQFVENVAGVVGRVAGFVVAAEPDVLAPHAYAPAVPADALRNASAQLTYVSDLPASAPLAATVANALAQLPASARAVLSTAHVEAALAKLPGTPGSANPFTTVVGADPAVVAKLTVFQTAALQAVAPAQVASAAAIFTALVADVGADALAATVEALRNTPPMFPPAAGSLPLGYVADVPSFVRRTVASSVARDAPTRTPGARARRDRIEDLLPDSDEDGRPYTAAEKARLASLVLDPRRGAAPEAQTALAVWRTFGLALTRDLGGEHDFLDAAGESWDVISDDDPARRERALSALAHVNVIVRTRTTLALRPRAAS